MPNAQPPPGRLARPLLSVCLMAGVLVGGCARSPEDRPPSRVVLDVIVRFAAPVNDAYFYFFAIDTDDDEGGLDGPIPVTSGPYIANGWGTGSITHFLEYNLGLYQIFRTRIELDLLTPAGGIVGATGSPDVGKVGDYTLTIDSISLGTATVTTITGPGAITGVTNLSGQNAGTFRLTTSAAGETVAGGVSFTPAADGGAAPSGAAAQQLAALNAGGVALAAESLDEFGLRLAISAAAERSGEQDVVVLPAVGQVSGRFVARGSGSSSAISATVTANSRVATATPPIPGITLETQALVVGQARIRTDFSDVADFLNYPFDSVDPGGGSVLRATLVLLGEPGEQILPPPGDQETINFNIIATDELLLDPNFPGPHHYDGLGFSGNDYVTISIKEDRIFRNIDAVEPEEADDTTTGGIQAVDVVDWTLQVRFLR